MTIPQLNLATIGIGKESTFNVEQTTLQPWPGLCERGDVTPTIKENEITISEFGDRNEAGQALHGASEYSIKIKFRIQNGRPFQWIQGGYSVAGTGPYTHSMTNASTIPSYTIEHVINPGGANSYSHKFIGAKCNELKLTMTKGQPIIAEATFFAASYTKDGTPGTNTINSTVPYEFHQHTTLDINSASYKTSARQMVFTMSNGLEREYGLNSRDAENITEGTRKSMFNFEVWETDDTLQDLYGNRTNFAIDVVITRGSDTITFGVLKSKIFEPTWDLGSNAVADLVPCRVIGDMTIDVVDTITTYDN